MNGLVTVPRSSGEEGGYYYNGQEKPWNYAVGFVVRDNLGNSIIVLNSENETISVNLNQ